MSWIAPQFLGDFSRTLQGLLLVASRAALRRQSRHDQIAQQYTERILAKARLASIPPEHAESSKNSMANVSILNQNNGEKDHIIPESGKISLEHFRTNAVSASDLPYLSNKKVDIVHLPDSSLSAPLIQNIDIAESRSLTEPTILTQQADTKTTSSGQEVINRTSAGSRESSFAMPIVQPIDVMHTTPESGTDIVHVRAVPATSKIAPSTQIQASPRSLQERKLPSTPLGRAFGFAGIGASLLLGGAREGLDRFWKGSQGREGESVLMSERGAQMLAEGLCRMRGAALKIGQMLSIQDEVLVPPHVQAAFERVRAGANIMPRQQLEGVMKTELGSDWRSKMVDFEYQPRAAASIGQVHRAVLHDGTAAAMKVQYPGVASSIESDVDNLMRLVAVTNLLPRGLFVEALAKVAKRELALECDYTYEAACQNRFRDLVASNPHLRDAVSVPALVPELSTPHILTSHWVSGVAIDKVCSMPQDVRDRVAALLMRLTVLEIFEWRFMQTDPNWGNFLYEESSGTLHLIDFGASREYPPTFADNYLRLVHACAAKDRAAVLHQSTLLGFLTGQESQVMLDAHAGAAFMVGIPFSTPGLYDFSRHIAVTAKVTELSAIMLKHRLKPPPEEAYSLHRKLSGAFLACMKLGARVPCHDIFYDIYNTHKWDASKDDEGKVAQVIDTSAQ